MYNYKLMFPHSARLTPLEYYLPPSQQRCEKLKNSAPVTFMKDFIVIKTQEGVRFVSERQQKQFCLQFEGDTKKRRVTMKWE